MLVAKLKGYSHRMSLRITNLNTMQSFDLDLFHFICDGVLAIPDESVNAGPHEKAGAQIVRSTKQFVDVTFLIANVNATHRVA